MVDLAGGAHDLFGVVCQLAACCAAWGCAEHGWGDGGTVMAAG